MEWIVLGLLLWGDATIYELNRAFSQGLALIYAASYGNLQYAIKKLLKDELISFTEKIEKGRNKKIYRINEQGREAFFQWIRSPINPSKLETIMLSKVFFLGLVEDNKDKIAILKDILRAIVEAEHELEGLQRSLKALPLSEEENKTARFQFKTLDYGILAHKAGRLWVQELLDEIKA